MAAKILLLKLPDPAKYVTTPPLGIGYIASYLKREGNDVHFLDLGVENLSDAKLISILKDKHYDFIGIQVYSYHLNPAKKYSGIIKKCLPHCMIVVGGPHPSSEPLHTLKYLGSVDFAIRSEGERSFALLVKLGMNPPLDGLKKIPNLVYRCNGNICENSVELEDDLDNFPLPDWGILNPGKYALAPQGIFAKNKTVAPISITRGCPYACTYCAGFAIMGRRIRKRSIDNVLLEIRDLYDKYGIRELHIIDDNFTFYREVVVEFCNKLIKENIDISWACPNGVRVDSLDRELLQLMERSGCVSFGLGIESGSGRILKKMKKKLSLDAVKEKVDLIKKCTSIYTTGFFLLGYPEETRADIIKTINFAKSLKLDMAAFTIVQPLPGTELFRYWSSKNNIKLDDMDWDRFFHIGVFGGVSELTEGELRQLQKKAVREFYLRPRIIAGILRRIKTASQLLIIMRRISSIFLGKKR